MKEYFLLWMKGYLFIYSNLYTHVILKIEFILFCMNEEKYATSRPYSDKFLFSLITTSH